MMAYNTIRICIFTLFLHSLLLTPCKSQNDNKIEKAEEKPTTLKTTTLPIQSTTVVTNTTAPPLYNRQCSPINFTADAIALMEAMRGFGTDEFTIIYLVSMRSNYERQMIRNEYKRIYNKDLIEDLKGELSGDLQTAVVSLMLTNHEFYAKELHDAMAGWGTDDEALAEILGTLNSSEIQNVAEIYHKVYGTHLKEDIVDDTSGYFRELLVRLCDATRGSDTEKVDKTKAVEDTRALILAGFDSLLKHTDAEEEKFISLLTSRSFPHLREIFDTYYNIKKRDIEVALIRFPYILRFTLTTIILRANDIESYYAKILDNAMDRWGTNNRQLIRVIVGRSEMDLDKIKRDYEDEFGSPLINDVSDETSGAYRNLLMAILRK